MDSASTSISRVALGSTAALGDLYDARRDAFCGISIFQKKIPETCLSLVDAPFSDVHLVHSDDISEKFTKMDVSAELQVSVLAGLFTLEGSGRYLSDQKQSARTVKSSLIYNVKTKDESVNIYHQDLKDAFALDAIESGMATHVVVGISWGANSILSCMYENRENREVKEIAGSLSAHLKKLSFSISGKASVDYNEGDNGSGKKFDIRMYGGILAKNEELPTTFEGALDLMKKLPNLVANSNEGKGKPLSYRLIPLSLLQSYLEFAGKADNMLRTLEKASLIRVVKFFEQLTAAQQQVHDFYQDCIDFKYCVEPKLLVTVSRLRDEMSIQETTLRSELSTVLTQVRSGKSDVAELESLICKFQQSPNSPQKVATTLASYSKIVEKINFARTLVSQGATYIGLGRSLDDEMLQSFDNKSFVLYFNQDAKTEAAEEWTGNRQLFFQELQKKEKEHKFYVVDCDVHPGLQIRGHFSCIQVLQAGQILFHNLLEEQKKAASVALANLISGTQRLVYKPSKRVPLAIPCTGNNCDPKQVYEWTCKKCLTVLEYGFDNLVYCNCGKTPAICLEFRCTDPKHGLNYDRHPEEFLTQLLATLRPFSEMNILILGETGVGKSTFINGFINFLRYESLEEAEAGELCTLIPSEFTVCDENFDEIRIKTGTDDNEVMTTGQSATQEAKVYPFTVGNTTIRIIDTPGIGDTRGIMQDQKNFQNILGTLSYLDELHGICILLKPNNARLNVMFRFGSVR